MTAVNLTRTVDEIESGMARGHHAGAVVHVRHRSEVVADLAVGFADGELTKPLQPDARMLLLSAGKPLTAAAFGLLVQEGRATFDDKVASYIPEFGVNGKEGVTLRHILTHTHAWQAPGLDWPRLTWAEIIERISNARIPDDREVGSYAAYDPQTGWYILAEVIQRITGEPFHGFVEREIVQRCGAERLSIGMEPSAWQRAVEEGSIVRLLDTTGSAADKTNLRGGAAPEPDKRLPHAWVGDDAQRASVHNPGGGALGTAGELAAFYDSLLSGGGALSQDIIEQMTSRQRTGLKDHSFRALVDWGLGFLVNSGRYGVEAAPYGYGRFASDETFGHGGMQSTSAYADPVNQLAVVIIFNGICGEPKHMKRVLEVNSALYQDLGLATQ